MGGAAGGRIVRAASCSRAGRPMRLSQITPRSQTQMRRYWGVSGPPRALVFQHVASHATATLPRHRAGAGDPATPPCARLPVPRPHTTALWLAARGRHRVRASKGRRDGRRLLLARMSGSRNLAEEQRRMVAHQDRAEPAAGCVDRRSVGGRRLVCRACMGTRDCRRSCRNDRSRRGCPTAGAARWDQGAYHLGSRP
jgi:hypothetical protein